VRTKAYSPSRNAAAVERNKQQVKSAFMDMIENRTFDEIQGGSVVALLLAREKWQAKL
jgi:hypothetical protein